MFLNIYFFNKYYHYYINKYYIFINISFYLRFAFFKFISCMPVTWLVTFLISLGLFAWSFAFSVVDFSCGSTLVDTFSWLFVVNFICSLIALFGFDCLASMLVGIPSVAVDKSRSWANAMTSKAVVNASPKPAVTTETWGSTPFGLYRN